MQLDPRQLLQLTASSQLHAEESNYNDATARFCKSDSSHISNRKSIAGPTDSGSGSTFNATTSANGPRTTPVDARPHGIKASSNDSAHP
jgi:hypothetical protein